MISRSGNFKIKIMKTLIPLLVVLACSLSFAQKVEETKELDKAPVDFLDVFDPDRLDMEFVRTTTNLVLTAGFNQALGDNNGIGDSYRFWGSGMFEIGLEFTTRLHAEKDNIRFNYGLGLRTNTLHINDNKAFFTNNNVTRLEPIGFDVDRSYFTQISIVAPFHLEFGHRELQTYKDGIKRYYDNDAFVFGVGGYLGLVSTSSQAIKFDREGRGVTRTVTNDYEVNNVLYGLSAYAGWDNFQLFATYGLNDIFKDSPLQERYLSFGIRLR
jgi:hypothetical protein